MDSNMGTEATLTTIVTAGAVAAVSVALAVAMCVTAVVIAVTYHPDQLQPLPGFVREPLHVPTVTHPNPPDRA